MVRPTLIDLNPVEVKYYPFMISLDECKGSCNVLSQKICVPKETNINVKVLNMIANKNEAKTKNLVIVNAKSIVQHVIRIKNGIIKHVNMNIKIILTAKVIIVGILAYIFVRIASI